MTRNEEDFYEPIAEALSRHFRKNGYQFYHEITANKNFSNKLKREIPNNRQIIFAFLKEVRPDITALIAKDSETSFLIVEVKKEKVKLDHIYQARKYGELFDAKIALLIYVDEEVPEEVKRLSEVTPTMLSLPRIGAFFTVGTYDRNEGTIGGWFPKDPLSHQ